MKIILFSIGTRGDMEPFLAIGEILKKNGHHVICVFPDQFRPLVEQCGMNFIPLGPQGLDVFESKEAKIAFGGKSSWLKRKIATIKMHIDLRRVLKSTTIREYEILQKEKPDLVLHNALNRYAFIWGFGNKNKSILVSAIPYVIHSEKYHSYVGINRNLGPRLNRFTYLFTNWGLAYYIQQGYRYLKIPGKESNRKIRDSVLQGKMIYTLSPALFPRPDDWSNNVQILGFHERDKQDNWNAPEELELFLKKHDKILFLTFGSIANSSPEEKTRIILSVLEAHNIPAIINTASGGLVVPPEYNSNLFYFVSTIPYEWILPQMYGIVHHGGVGTTHIGLKYGCVNLIIPHVFDQFNRNAIIAEKGLGPKGIPITKITEKNLEPLILDLFNNTSYKEKADELSRQMNRENLEEELYRFIVGKKEDKTCV